MVKLFALVVLSLDILAAVESTRSNSGNDSYSELAAFSGQDYAITWPNGSALQLNLSRRETSGLTSIDCFGLGSTVAQTLEWLFAVNGNHTNVVDVRFFFSSRKQPRRVHLISGEQFGLEWTNFDIERRTVFIVHGFLSNGSRSWVERMEKAFLLWGDVNVVVVDWSARGNTFNYVKAAINTRTVGNEIARLLHNIVNATIAKNSPREPTWGTLHLVGHSLGAHICGFAASEFKRRQNRWNVSRITGLDPANRCFGNVTASVRLNANDATFVDVIHTNGRGDGLFAFGSPYNIGHVDFYPNGGKGQPGCSQQEGLIWDLIQAPQTMLERAICSHGYSYIYFTDSLIATAMGNCSFWAHRWDRSYRRALQLISEVCTPSNCTEMGIRAEIYPHRGTFFVATSRKSPFCITDSKGRREVRKQLQLDYANEILD